MQNDYLQNQFRGDVRPILRKRSDNPPVLEKALKVGVKETGSGTFYTSIKIQLKAGNLQYPEPALFLSVNGGGKNVFSKITIDDILNIHGFIEAIFEEIKNRYDEESKKSVIIKQQLDAANAAIKAAGINPDSLNLSTMQDEN